MGISVLSWKSTAKTILKTFLAAFIFVLFLITFVGIYFVGVVNGYKMGQKETESQFSTIIDSLIEKSSITPTTMPQPTLTPASKETRQVPVTWGGPQLWEAVNKERQKNGVNPLSSRAELCTIASIRLNELLEMGKLDNHEGFSNLKERRPDLAWIFEKYSVLAEFLAFGGHTPEETVSLWENTLGHKKLLTGGEYVWGCIYAQNTFAVAITAY